MQIEYTDEIKKNLAKLARRYRHIYQDVQPVIDQLTAGETPGDQISGVGYPTYKVRIKNSDISKGKSSGYRLLYYLQTIEQIVEEMRGGGARRTRFAGQTGACLSGKVRPLFPSLKGREAAVAIRRPRLRDRRVG
jgi:mRNA-degrading endonuclease RelE of RelBE toxin-antitoxin system